jgi:hypothetical protein
VAAMVMASSMKNRVMRRVNFMILVVDCAFEFVVGRLVDGVGEA